MSYDAPSRLQTLCPMCGKYISREDAPRERNWIWVVAIAVVLICTVLVLLRLM